MTEEDEVGHLEVISDFKLRVTNYDHNSFPDESCYEKGLEELTKVACQSNDESVFKYKICCQDKVSYGAY